VEIFNLEFFLGFYFLGAPPANVLPGICLTRMVLQEQQGRMKIPSIPAPWTRKFLSILSWIMMDEDGSTTFKYFPTASVDNVNSHFAEHPKYYCTLPHF